MNEFEVIRYPQMGGMNLFFDTVDYRTAHIHTEWELILPLENSLAITCGQQRYLAEEGELVLFSPNQPHEFHKVEASCTILCVQLAPNCVTQVFPAAERIAVEDIFPRQHLSEEEYREVKDRIWDMLGVYLRRESCYELYCLGQGSLVLHRLLTGMPYRTMSAGEVSQRDRSNARLKRLIRFVDENYMHKVRLSDFAEAEGCSMSYLSHFVKAALNQSFQQYVNTVRFNCACKLIASGKGRMLDICMESGFSDYRYFARTFREQIGITPEEYRKQVKRPEDRSDAVKHSLHSLERFYTREESISLWERFSGKQMTEVRRG